MVSKRKSRASLGRLSAGSEVLKAVRILMIYYGDTTPLQLITRLVARDMSDIAERRQSQNYCNIDKD